jgi:hypothetical protein
MGDVRVVRERAGYRASDEAVYDERQLCKSVRASGLPCEQRGGVR